MNTTRRPISQVLPGTSVGRVIFVPAFCVVMLFSATIVEATLITSNLVSPPGLNPGDQYRLVFVTSYLYPHNASSSDIAVYNAHVTTVANTVSELVDLSTTWTAIASTPAVDARDNTGTNPGVSTGVPIYRLDGVRVANNYADLWDGVIINPISVTETGGSYGGYSWTGTASDGTGKNGYELGTNPGLEVGAPWIYTFDGWISAGSYDDAAFARNLYAMSGTMTVVPEPSTLTMGAVALLILAAAGIARRHP